jgi:hypothetical protein
MTRETGRVIEPARDPTEAWRLLESHFGRQTAIIDELISQLLSTERVVNDRQIPAHYSKTLMAIREAKELGRLQDLLTASRIELRERYHPPEGGCPPTPRPRNLGRAGVGRAEVGEVGVELPDLHSREGSPLPTQEECQDWCSRLGRLTRCRGWPS